MKTFRNQHSRLITGAAALSEWRQLEQQKQMSFQTGTSVELLYQSIATGTQLNTFTTEDNLQKTLPHCFIPAGFFNLNTGKSIRVRASGQLGTTGTPTFTFSLRLLTSTTWSAAGVVWSSAAITAGSGVTLAPWYIDFDLICSVVGTGGGSNTTLRGMGEVRGGTSLAAGGGVYSIPGANVAITNSIDSTVSQYLYLSVACGTSNASNLCQLTMLKVYGEN